jgi:hypothetical protein
MSSRFATDVLLLLHLAFIMFALLGAILAYWWRWILYAHLPAAAWAVFVELTGQFCPLTTLENELRIEAGLAGYSESFIEHYVLGVIYPAGLTTEIQVALAAVVVAINVGIYGWLFYLANRKRRRGPGRP